MQMSTETLIENIGNEPDVVTAAERAAALNEALHKAIQKEIAEWNSKVKRRNQKFAKTGMNKFERAARGL